MNVHSKCLKTKKTRNNFDTLYTAFWKLDFNEQKDFERLDSFRNGVI